MIDGKIRVVVTSESVHKVSATTSVFHHIFDEKRVIVTARKSVSGVAEQPDGHAEILTGALGRIRYVKDTYLDQYDYIVSIESGVFRVDLFGRSLYIEIAWIIIENKLGIQAFALSNGMEAIPEYVKEALERGFEHTTIGAVLAEHEGGDATDPCGFYTNGLLSREEVLREGIRSALGQLARKVNLRR